MTTLRIFAAVLALCTGCTLVGDVAPTEPDAPAGLAENPHGQPASPTTQSPLPLAAAPLVAPASEWLSGDAAGAEAGCAKIAGALNRKKCTHLASTQKFQRRALAFCDPIFATSSADGVKCLIIAAQQPVALLATKVCAQFHKPEDAVRCFEAVAGRELADHDIHACDRPARARSTARCLRNAPDYAFDRDELNAMALRATAQVRNHPVGAAGEGADLNAVISALRTEVEAAAPSGGRSEEDRFLLNFAGGAIGHYKMLYCSAHEYIMVFGTPLATSGYSGKYRFEVNDWVFAGEMQTHREGRLDTDAFVPGSWAQLFPGESKVYTSTDGTYMLEYARGPISSAYKFGIVAPTRSLSRNRANRRAQIRTCADGLVANERARRRMARTKRERRKQLRREIATQLSEIRL